MKRAIFLCLSFVAIIVLSANGQDTYNNCERKYFARTHKTSTSICFDDNMRWGKATAYDINGRQIYQREIRRIGGSAGVIFSYYDNGAVKKADYSSQPDGGIQWYKVITYFAPDGSITSEDDQSYNTRNNISVPTTVRKPPSPSKRQNEVATCAVPYATEFWFVNNTTFPVVALVLRKGNAKDIKAIVIQPSDTVKGGEYVMAGQFVDLSMFYEFLAKPVPDINQRLFLRTGRQSPVPYQQSVKRYFYHISMR